MNEKPNIVFILSDQHRGDSLGAMGHPVVQTPHIDKMAAEGVIFDNCFTNAPLCMPARASLMTGQYVREHGAWNNGLQADPTGPSHVRQIRDAGYHTALIGKTHLYLNRPGARHTRDYEPTLRQWGFEETLETHGLILSIFSDSAYTEHLAGKGLLDLHRRHMIDYTIPWVKGKARPWEDKPSPLPEEDLLDNYIGRRAAEWIRNYEGADKAFYLQVLFLGPHDPYDTPDAYRARYNPADVPSGIKGRPGDPVPVYVREILDFSDGIKAMTEEQMKQMRSLYYAKVSLIDDNVGRILHALEEKGILDNTWVIYSSDHGDMLGDHGLTQKAVFYEGAIRIPLVMRPPGGRPGSKNSGLCDLIDLAATLIDIAGAQSLKESTGQTLCPAVQQEKDGRPENSGKEVVFSEVVGYSMVRDQRYKLVVEADSLNPVEMYDLLNDPQEQINIVNHDRVKKVKESYIDAYFKPFDKFLDRQSFNLKGEVQEVMPKKKLLKILETLKSKESL